MDEGLKVAGIFADLSKAFDMVDHELLLKKLEHYGIRGGASLILRSYLSDRKQQVAVETKEGLLQLSNWEFITCGVPQGSILGSLLFILYINDLPGYVHPLKSILYADDTNIIITDKNPDNLLTKVDSSTLDMLNVWFKANKLSLNLDKTRLIQFRANGS